MESRLISVEMRLPNPSVVQQYYVRLRTTLLSNWAWSPLVFFPQVFYPDPVTRVRVVYCLLLRLLIHDLFAHTWQRRVSLVRSSCPMNRPAGVLPVVECVVDLYANRKLAIRCCMESFPPLLAFIWYLNDWTIFSANPLLAADMVLRVYA